MQEERHLLNQTGYELAVRGEHRRWTWTLIRRDAVAARGEEPDRVSAWRSGAFAADAISALEAISRRRF